MSTYVKEIRLGTYMSIWLWKASSSPVCLKTIANHNNMPPRKTLTKYLWSETNIHQKKDQITWNLDNDWCFSGVVCQGWSPAASDVVGSLALARVYSAPLFLHVHTFLVLHHHHIATHVCLWCAEGFLSIGPDKMRTHTKIQFINSILVTRRFLNDASYKYSP